MTNLIGHGIAWFIEIVAVDVDLITQVCQADIGHMHLDRRCRVQICLQGSFSGDHRELFVFVAGDLADDHQRTRRRGQRRIVCGTGRRGFRGVYRKRAGISPICGVIISSVVTGTKALPLLLSLES